MNILCVEQDRTKLRQLKRDASAFLLRPYEKQRLARAFSDPRFASE